MSAFLRKGKQNTKDSARRSLLMLLGIPIVIFFIVILILVSRFSVISKKSAKDDIYNDLITRMDRSTTEINYRLTGSAYIGHTAASVIGAQGEVDYKGWYTYAKQIQRGVGQPYLVALVDMKGKGVTSESETIDLSSQEYFAETHALRYVLAKDDGILNKAAIISVIPINNGRNDIGMIYIFNSLKDYERLLPLGEFDGHPSFAVINSNSDILLTTGEETRLIQGDSFIKNMETVVFHDSIDVSKVKAKVMKQARFAFSAQMGSENKTIVVVPIGIRDWQLVTVLNQTYMDRMLNLKWENARSMIIQLILTVSIFLGVIVLISIWNKLKYNAENKDLADKADTDLLTDLNNKIATERKIREYLEENPNTLCLMFLFDIDNFKKINDTMGHAFGDEVLRSLGHQLSNEFRVTDIIGRTGGDEFTLFLKDIKSDEQLEREGARLTNLFHHFTVGEYVKYSATASIGAVVFPRDAKDFDGLYKAADRALYHAKSNGKNQLVFYNKINNNTTKNES